MRTQEIPRCVTADIGEAASKPPIVVVVGPRQAGKRTVLSVVGRPLNAHAVTFQEISACAAATRDPEGYLRRLPVPTILDDVPAVPALWGALAQAPGRFLITSSVDLRALPALAQALGNRGRVFTLYPLSAGEAVGVREGFVHTLFKPTVPWPREALDRRPWNAAMTNATFPALAAAGSGSRAAWCEEYLTTLLHRDLLQLTAVERRAAWPAVLTGLAAQVGEFLNDAALARHAGLNAVTFRRYRALLGAAFLLFTVPPWSRPVGKPLVKAPKLYFTDTTLLCHLLRVDPAALLQQYPTLATAVVENFVASELTKQLARPENAGTLSHLHTYDGQGVDFVMEQSDGRLVAIAVRAAASVSDTDLAALRRLRAWAGSSFVRGVVLYLGLRTITFEKSLIALPLSSLWTLGARPL